MSMIAMVCAALMIKDEVSVIAPTLAALVRGGIQHFLIYDTGSTDRTQDAVRAFFTEHTTCVYHLVEEPFVDFATSRNCALDHAEQLFPDIPFVFMPDAEWYLQGTDLPAFCAREQHSLEPAYAVLLKNKALGVQFHIPRLLRQKSHVRFTGVVHETINVPYRYTLPDTIYCDRITSEQGDAKSSARWLRDYHLLKTQCASNPRDPRAWFYLGQTCACLGWWEEAYDAHIKRIELGGASDEELYLAQYRLGLIVEKLYQQQKMSLAQVVRHYMAAYAMRPHRAEPLIRLAEVYYREGKLPAVHLFAAHACTIPYPTFDTSLVDTYDYEVTRYDLLRAASCGSING